MSDNQSVAYRFFSLVGFASLFTLTVIGCERKGPPVAFERPPAPVTVVVAEARDVPVYLDEIGKCVARERVAIQPQVSGRITEVHFTDGANVKTGDFLFTIDPRPYQARFAAAQATVAQNKAVLALAKTEFAHIEKMFKADAASQEEYENKKSAVDVGVAQIQESEAAVETARLNLEYCSIRSPIDGRASDKLVDLGNVVNPTSGPLLVIQRLDPIYADFTVTESDLTVVQKNMAQRTLNVQVWLPESPDKPRSGELTFIDNAVQDATGTVRLRATIPNSDHWFWPNRFVKVRLILGTIKDAVLVPAGAPQTSGTGPFVYIVNGESKAEFRPVTLGQRQGDLVVINTGLKSGERVVTLGQLGVTPGGKVRIEEAAAEENAPVAKAGGKS